MADSELSNAELLAGVVAGTVKQSSWQAVKHIDYRIPIWLVAKVDALAKKSGKSRNSMLNSLVEVGLDAVLPLLKSDDAKELNRLERLAYSALGGSEVSADD